MTTTNNLYQVVQGATANAADLNQIVQTLTGLNLANPGPLVQIATQAINTTVSTVTFSSIPAYNHLYLVWSGRSTTATTTTGLQFRINGDSGANYLTQFVSANGNATPAGAGLSGQSSGQLGEIAGASASATSQVGAGFSAFPFWSTSANSQLVISNGGVQFGTTGTLSMTVEDWLSAYTATGTARTSLTLFPAAGSFAGTVAGGSIFTLYGSM